MSNERTSPQKGIQYKPSEEFVNLYANNAQLLSSNWDLEITFGQLDQKQGPNVVVQTGSVTLPWPAAKVLWYFLTLHLMGHEFDFGRVIIPAGIIPEFPAQKSKEFASIKEEAFQAVRRFYLDFIKTNPEAAPAPTPPRSAGP